MKRLIPALLICLPAFGQAVATGPGQTFVQRGNGAKVRDIQDKLRDIVNVRDFGALCDGATDDRLAIQAAIDAAAGGTLIFPNGRPCTVSSPGVFLYPANSGITVIGYSSAAKFAGSGGGLIAYAPSAPGVVLTIYAANVKLTNLLVDCNNKAATNGIVSVFGVAGIWENVTARDCRGDGAVANQYATPATSVTAGGSAGSTTVTVASVSFGNGISFGTLPCYIVMFGYGTSSAEQHVIRRVSGNVLTIDGRLAFSQAGGAAQCAGNNNEMQIAHYSSFRNGGWGWRIVPGSDENAISWFNGSSTDNALGGELWCGGGLKHYGGDYEGDGGPAVQLGDLTGGAPPYPNGCLTHYMTIGPLGDVEEKMAAYNTVSAVCDDTSQVQFTLPAHLTIQTGANACPPYRNGTTTTGIGTDNHQRFVIKDMYGTIGVQPGPGGIGFYNSSGTLLNTLGISNNNGLGAGMPVTDYMHSQLEANGGPAPSGGCGGCKLMMGYRTDTKEGFIQSTVYPSTTTLLTLNPTGGAVRLGATGTVSGLPPSCVEGDRRFATNASSTTFNDVAIDAGARGNHVPVFCDGSHVWRIG